jgi:hypothetical protein
MKTMNAIKKTLLIAASVWFCSSSFAGEMVDRFSSLEASEGYFWGDDTIYYFTNFTIVQDYENNDPDERLSMQSLSSGDWLVISYDHNDIGQMTAKKILIVPDESTAYSVLRSRI